MSDKPRLDPDTLSSNLGIRPADVRAAVDRERHNEDVAKKKKKLETEDILQPTSLQLVLLQALKKGPVDSTLLSDERRTDLDTLVQGGLVEVIESTPHAALRTAQDVVLTYTLTERGSHVLKAVLAAPGDIEQLIAEAEHWDPGVSIDMDGDYAKAIIALYALLLRRFILRGVITDLHVQAQYALDRFGT